MKPINKSFIEDYSIVFIASSSKLFCKKKKFGRKRPLHKQKHSVELLYNTRKKH